MKIHFESLTKPNSSKVSLTVLLLILPTLVLGGSLSGMPATSPTIVSPQPSISPAISIEPHFSPEEVIGPVIVKLINGSQRSLDIAAYSFTHTEIAAAVIRAHNRGVQVRLVMDLLNASGRDSRVPDLIKAGIEVRIRHRDGDQHSKYLIIDKVIVVTGSYNFTARADERNSENIVVIRNAPKVDKAYASDFGNLVLASEQRKRKPSNPF